MHTESPFCSNGLNVEFEPLPWNNIFEVTFLNEVLFQHG
jgi:hypothetical protein